MSALASQGYLRAIRGPPDWRERTVVIARGYFVEEIFQIVGPGRHRSFVSQRCKNIPLGVRWSIRRTCFLAVARLAVRESFRESLSQDHSPYFPPSSFQTQSLPFFIGVLWIPCWFGLYFPFSSELLVIGSSSAGSQCIESHDSQSVASVEMGVFPI